jgi:hypothetical protein
VFRLKLKMYQEVFAERTTVGIFSVTLYNSVKSLKTKIILATTCFSIFHYIQAKIETLIHPRAGTANFFHP